MQKTSEMTFMQPRYRDFILIALLFALWWMRLPLLLALRDSMPENVYQLWVQITKILFWIVPVVAYIRLIERAPVLETLLLRRQVLRGIVYGMAAPLLYLGILGIAQVFGANLLHFNPSVPFWTWISAVLLAGVTEEIVFRGYVLIRLQRSLPFWQANGVTAVLFLLMHLPFWILIGFTPRLMDVATLVTLGLILGWLVHRSGSLWSAIVAHTLYDFMVVFLFR